jgi:hypothetical protein
MTVRAHADDDNAEFWLFGYGYDLQRESDSPKRRAERSAEA